MLHFRDLKKILLLLLRHPIGNNYIQIYNVLQALLFLLKITQRSEMCIKNFYSVNHLSLCYNVIKIISHDIKSHFIIHTTNIKKKLIKNLSVQKKILHLP